MIATVAALASILGGYAVLAVLARALTEAARIWSSRLQTERIQARRELLARRQEATALLAFAEEVNDRGLCDLPPAATETDAPTRSR